jgi:hypothetical protein
LISLNTVVVTPMPRPSEMIPAIAKPGDLINVRSA